MKKPTKYKMRAECQADLGRFLTSVSINTVSAKHGVILGNLVIPDVEVTFTSTWTLDEIRAVVIGIEDGHVMLETVNVASKYTGERMVKSC